jgi:hypothetical protein
MRVRLIQLDGDLPNLALMRMAHFYRSQGCEVHFSRNIYPTFDEQGIKYDAVYASAIFTTSRPTVVLCKQQWPDAIIGGTWQAEFIENRFILPPGAPTVEQFIGQHHAFDYSDYPNFEASIGFTQRGCRFKCFWCIVHTKEPILKAEDGIYAIWRGEPHPRKIHLLDNDFFGVPEWQERIKELTEGGFRVCFSQGINIRMITEETAAALASVQYRNTTFAERKLYTAWDQLGDEKRFFDGVAILESAGIPAKHLCAYMLCGADKKENWNRIWYRFRRMTERGIEPFVMVYDRTRTDLIAFQRWANQGMYRIKGCSWPEYIRKTKSPESVEAWREVYA